MQLLNREVKNAKNGLFARAIIKVNSLVDEDMCLAIFKAAQAGVKIDLIVRGIFCLPLSGNEPNIHAISIIDKYLEHSRVFYFENDGNPELFIGSGDLMQRNIDFRIEVTTPILDKAYKEQLIQMLECQLNDTEKARVLDVTMSNKMVSSNAANPIRAQEEFYHLLRDYRLAEKEQKIKLVVAKVKNHTIKKINKTAAKN
jgi:polyphosphate kinase